MSARGLSATQARGVVEARLGRPPQDMLEAAVTLEAWAGVPGKAALDLGHAMMRTASAYRARSASAPPEAPPVQPHVILEAVAFVVAVLAVATWAAPLSSSAGRSVVGQALTLALPVTLAGQWIARSRYLGRPDGLAHLARAPWQLSVVALGVLCVSWAILGTAGALGGLLSLIWIGGAILIRRSWSLLYATIVLGATVVMLLGVSATLVVASAAAVTALAVVAALASARAEPDRPPGRWGQAAVAGMVGLGFGLLLAGDPSVGWGVHGDLPALALLPSTIASFWGGWHLWRFRRAIPDMLSGASLLGDDVRRLWGAPVRMLLGAVARLVGLTALLSLVVVAAGRLLAVPVSSTSVFVGFGLMALATLCVSLLESVGSNVPTLVATSGAILAECVVRFAHLTSIAGGGLIVGASVAILLALPYGIALLARPERALATALWIS
jgi:hypothetical protein